MRFKDQVYFGCAAYSMLHPHRASELNHLFLVIGNGYEWTKRGDLVAVCDSQFYKNGKPMSLDAAINKIFRDRRKDDEERKRYTRNEKARNKRAWTHSVTCLKTTNCNCGGSDPHDAQCCINFPGTATCDCGAQARYDAAHPKGRKLDEFIKEAIEAMRQAEERDPVGFEEKRKQQEVKWKAQRQKWREEKKWEYRVPTDIKQRVAYQKPKTGAYNGYNHWYPACQYSKIVTFPDNIKNDWLLGIIEVCQLVIATPPEPRCIPGQDTAAAEREVQATVSLCEKALERAIKLAAKRRLKGYSPKEVAKVTSPAPKPGNLTKVGQRVQIVKDVPWTTSQEAVASKPKIGLKGKIANPTKYPYPTPPEGHSAVWLLSTDLGYEEWDEDHKYQCRYIPTDCLKAI